MSSRAWMCWYRKVKFGTFVKGENTCKDNNQGVVFHKTSTCAGEKSDKH